MSIAQHPVQIMLRTEPLQCGEPVIIVLQCVNVVVPLAQDAVDDAIINRSLFGWDSRDTAANSKDAQVHKGNCPVFICCLSRLNFLM